MKDGAGFNIYGLRASVESTGSNWVVKLQYSNLTTPIGNPLTISSTDHNDEAYCTALLNEATVTPSSKTLYYGGMQGNSTKLTASLPDAIQIVNTYTSTSIIKGKIEGMISYSSSDSNVASVSEDGLVTAKGKGTAKINTVITLANGIKKEFSTAITVKKAYIKITSSTNVINVKSKYTFIAKAYGYNTQNNRSKYS